MDKAIVVPVKAEECYDNIERKQDLYLLADALRDRQGDTQCHRLGGGRSVP